MQNLDNSSVDLAKIESGDDFTIYVVIPPSKLVSHSILLRLWISIFLQTVMKRTIVPKRRTLFMLDECAQLGYLEGLKSATTLLRGYGLQVWMFFQDQTQLESIYGIDSEGIINNCSILQSFGFSRPLAAEPIAEIVGNFTAEQLVRLPKDRQIVSSGKSKTHILKSLRYYSDEFFRGRWDPNPFWFAPPPSTRRVGFTSNILKN
jgi:Type IV secretory pathway, VirD4 components